jgi:hypothetical protein
MDKVLPIPINFKNQKAVRSYAINKKPYSSTTTLVAFVPDPSQNLIAFSPLWDFKKRSGPFVTSTKRPGSSENCG